MGIWTNLVILLKCPDYDFSLGSMSGQRMVTESRGSHHPNIFMRSCKQDHDGNKVHVDSAIGL